MSIHRMLSALMFTLYKSNDARSDTKMYSWIKKLDENDILVVINYCSSKFCISYFVVMFMVNWFLSQQQHICTLKLELSVCTCLSILAHVCCFYSLYMPINVSYLKHDSLNIIMKLKFFSSRLQIGVYQMNVLEIKKHNNMERLSETWMFLRPVP